MKRNFLVSLVGLLFFLGGSSFQKPRPVYTISVLLTNQTNTALGAGWWSDDDEYYTYSSVGASSKIFHTFTNSTISEGQITLPSGFTGGSLIIALNGTTINTITLPSGATSTGWNVGSLAPGDNIAVTLQ